MSDEKPITQSEQFIAELHTGEMDLSKLYDKLFIVAVSAGDRNKCKHLASTIKGPYDFCQMATKVGEMWENEKHHAKVTILSQEDDSPVEFLDSGTVDYLEANYVDVIAEYCIRDLLGSEPRPIEAGTFTDKE